jgi:hypothetical protein
LIQNENNWTPTHYSTQGEIVWVMRWTLPNGVAMRQTDSA